MVLDGLLKRLDLFQRGTRLGRRVLGAFCHLVLDAVVRVYCLAYTTLQIAEASVAARWQSPQQEGGSARVTPGDQRVAPGAGIVSTTSEMFAGPDHARGYRGNLSDGSGQEPS